MSVSSSFSDSDESVARSAPYALLGGSPGRFRQLCCSRFFKWLPPLGLASPVLSNDGSNVGFSRLAQGLTRSSMTLSQLEAILRGLPLLQNAPSRTEYERVSSRLVPLDNANG